MVNYRSEHKDDKSVAKTLKPKIKPLTAEKAIKMVQKTKDKK
jgi:hypothetical protein